MFKLSSISASTEFQPLKEPKTEIPSVELVAEFVKVELQEFRLYVMVGVKDAPLGVADGDMHPRQNLSDFFLVIHDNGLVGSHCPVLFKGCVCAGTVRSGICLPVCRLFYPGSFGGSLQIVYYLHLYVSHDFRGTPLLIGRSVRETAFSHDKDGCLALASTSTFERAVFLSLRRLGGEEPFVYLHISMKIIACVTLAHHVTKLVHHFPYGLVTLAPQLALDFLGGYGTFGRRQKVHGGEPVADGQVASLHHSTGTQGHLMLTVHAGPRTVARIPTQTQTAAAATEKTVAFTETTESLLAGAFVRILTVEVKQIHCVSFQLFYMECLQILFLCLHWHLRACLNFANLDVCGHSFKYNYHTLSGYRTNFLSNTLMDLFAGSDVPADKDNGGYSDATARVNFFGRVNYSYKDKYLAEVTMRYDGSMNFAPGHRWGLFPSFSLGWVMSEEKFFEPVKPYVDFLKLKASWGQMGNDNISAYQYLSQYAFTGTGAYFGSGDGAALNKGFYLTRTANPLVTWETANTTNLGFSASFLNGMFSLDFDWFKSKRRDILITRSASIPAYSGLVLPAENLGKVNNSGVEIVASYRDRAGDFEWGITGNFTYAENKVVYMDEAVATPEWQRTTGNPIDGLVLYKALGIYQNQEQVDNTPHMDNAAPGDLIYQDTNGDGTITWDDAIRLNESATPKIVYGFTLNGSWKGLDLNVFFQGQAKAVQLVQPTMNMVTDFYEGRWRTENTPEENLNARWPKAFIKQTYGDTWNGSASTWWLRNAAFLRLKSVEIGYTLPKAWTSKIGIQRWRFYVNGNNLFTFDKMKICDPEVGTSKDDNGYAINSNGILAYPLQRMITFGTNITF